MGAVAGHVARRAVARVLVGLAQVVLLNAIEVVGRGVRGSRNRYSRTLQSCSRTTQRTRFRTWVLSGNLLFELVNKIYLVQPVHEAFADRVVAGNHHEPPLALMATPFAVCATHGGCCLVGVNVVGVKAVVFVHQHRPPVCSIGPRHHKVLAGVRHGRFDTHRGVETVIRLHALNLGDVVVHVLVDVNRTPVVVLGGGHHHVGAVVADTVVHAVRMAQLFDSEHKHVVLLRERTVFVFVHVHHSVVVRRTGHDQNARVVRYCRAVPVLYQSEGRTECR